MNSEPPDGATPLDADEAEGLLHTHVVTRGELDELEEENIQIRTAYIAALRVADAGDIQPLVVFARS